MARTKKFEALVRFEHDGHVTKPGGSVSLLYGSDQDIEYADTLVRTKVLAEVVDKADEDAKTKGRHRQ